jgi:hypothetical protein
MFLLLSTATTGAKTLLEDSAARAIGDFNLSVHLYTVGGAELGDMAVNNRCTLPKCVRELLEGFSVGKLDMALTDRPVGSGPRVARLDAPGQGGGQRR